MQNLDCNSVWSSEQICYRRNEIAMRCKFIWILCIYAPLGYLAYVFLIEVDDIYLIVFLCFYCLQVLIETWLSLRVYCLMREKHHTEFLRTKRTMLA